MCKKSKSSLIIKKCIKNAIVYIINKFEIYMFKKPILEPNALSFFQKIIFIISNLLLQKKILSE